MRVALTANAVAFVLALPMLQAQPGSVGAACDIDANSPKELAVISIKFQGARGQQNPETRKTALLGILRDLDTKPERFAKNPAGYQYTMSQVLSMLAVEPGIGMMPTRGTLGISGTPTETYDMVAHIDSAFMAVDAAAPVCSNEVSQLRQNDVWLALTRRALDASNNNQLDTADYYARQSVRLSKASPYPYYVMGNVANARSDKKEAVAQWKRVVEVAGTDSTYADIRNGSLYYIGLTELEQASALKGPEAQALARDAAETLAELMKSTGETADTPNIMQGMADALTIAGDSAKIATIYAPIIASPDKFNDFSNTMGGVIATRANKLDDATVMFEAAVKHNPTARDALRNLAATYYAKEQFTKMLDPSSKLVALDPNNFDGWMMFAYAYQGLAQGSKVPAEKKAYTDSLVKYRTLADGLPVKLDVTSFQRSPTGATLGITLEQQAPGAGTYTVVVEFLNGSGEVVTTETQSVGPVTKGNNVAATFKTTGNGIVGYRYKPIK